MSIFPCKADLPFTLLKYLPHRAPSAKLSPPEAVPLFKDIFQLPSSISSSADTESKARLSYETSYSPYHALESQHNLRL